MHLEKGSHFVRDTMNNLERRLEKNGFIRIHSFHHCERQRNL